MARLVRDDLDFAIKPLEKIVFHRRVRIAQRLVACANANRLKTIRITGIVRHGAIDKVIGVDQVVVRAGIVPPHDDGHAGVILILEAIVIHPIVLAKDFDPMVSVVDTGGVVADNRRVGQAAVGGFAVGAAEFDDSAGPVGQGPPFEPQTVRHQPTAGNIERRITVENRLAPGSGPAV